MTTFDEREAAFEKKYAHDAEMQFKAEARRNKLFGLWAAAKMGMKGDAADAYAKSVVVADLKEAGDQDVLSKVAGDLAGKGIKVAEAELRKKMGELMAEAKGQVLSEKGA